MVPSNSYFPLDGSVQDLFNLLPHPLGIWGVGALEVLPAAYLGGRMASPDSRGSKASRAVDLDQSGAAANTPRNPRDWRWRLFFDRLGNRRSTTDWVDRERLR